MILMSCSINARKRRFATPNIISVDIGNLSNQIAFHRYLTVVGIFILYRKWTDHDKD